MKHKFIISKDGILKTLKRRLVVLLSAALLSMPAVAATFSETQVLANQGYADAQYNLGVMYDVSNSRN